MANFRVIGGGEVSASINDPNVLLPSSAIIEPTLTKGTRNTNYLTGYYKVGTRVYVSVGVSDLTPVDVNTIFTLPTGYRPNKVMSTIAYTGTNNFSSNALIQVASDGKVNVYTSSGINAGYGYVEFDAIQ